MCRKLSIILLLCVVVFAPSIASAQESIWSRQKIAIASISDRTERGLDENYKRSIYAKIRDVLVTNFDTFEVNIDDVKNQLRASNLPPSPQNIRKKIGERGADFIVFTEIRATSSAYDAYNANAQIIIILSQHRIVTGKEVSRTITVSPNQSAVTGGVGQLISELFGVSTSGQSASQNTYGSQPAQQSARTQTIKIGDVLYNDGRAGIVFSVDTSMQQGLIVSVDESQLIIENAKYWCEELGKSWRLPSVGELELIYRNVDVINASLERNGYSTRIYKEDYYWSNLVSDGWICVSMNDGVGYRDLGDSFNRVRAVSAFSLNSHNNSSSSTHQYSSYNNNYNNNYSNSSSYQRPSYQQQSSSYQSQSNYGSSNSSSYSRSSRDYTKQPNVLVWEVWTKNNEFDLSSEAKQAIHHYIEVALSESSNYKAYTTADFKMIKNCLYQSTHSAIAQRVHYLYSNVDYIIFPKVTYASNSSYQVALTLELFNIKTLQSEGISYANLSPNVNSIQSTCAKVLNSLLVAHILDNK